MGSAVFLQGVYRNVQSDNFVSLRVSGFCYTRPIIQEECCRLNRFAPLMAQKLSWFSVTIYTEMAETEVDFVSVGHCGLFRLVRVPFMYGETVSEQMSRFWITPATMRSGVLPQARTMIQFPFAEARFPNSRLSRATGVRAGI